MATVPISITTDSKLLAIIIFSLLFTAALSVLDDTATYIDDKGVNLTEGKEYGWNLNQSRRRSHHYHNYFYRNMKDYFMQLKENIYVRLRKAQPDVIDDAIEFQSWILSVISVIIISFVFICCFIPLVLCLACKLFGCCTCNGCRTCF